MATAEHIEKMLLMMQKQMEQLDTLRNENSELRTTITTNNNTPNQQQRPKTKAPDRPTVNTQTDEREWELFKDS